MNTDFKCTEQKKERTFRQKRKFSSIMRLRGAWHTDKFQKDQIVLFINEQNEGFGGDEIKQVG